MQLMARMTLFITSRWRMVIRFLSCMVSRTTTSTITTMENPAKMAPATK